ncbi:Uncharacterised protein [Mycobacterium tuberculosis]|uniref:Uncharacterized protein n=1 Tax=Mycobacterium tuberculosis TaxID=1773 RepID=A0A916LCD0_MYCTX|nr:Uncharacterised protein [Mycobacterium tuberculosis]COW41652.1 Uncharacterised protein [Mycobacterium tuberculosis]COY69971.1 Uncharacterised protein [Mycobacterium tuberculosis]COY70530.1 Uncharacterised protein [Mycobacterium tuberculosis]
MPSSDVLGFANRPSRYGSAEAVMKCFAYSSWTSGLGPVVCSARQPATSSAV